MITPRQIKIDGIVPIIPTPFDEKEQIDWATLSALLEFACGIDVCAIYLPAYASEFYKLSDANAARPSPKPSSNPATDARDRAGECRTPRLHAVN